MSLEEDINESNTFNIQQILKKVTILSKNFTENVEKGIVKFKIK